MPAETSPPDHGAAVHAQLGEWLWCARCTRSFHKGEARQGDDLLTRCPYEDCDGTLAHHGWTWTAVRSAHPELPEVPTRDVCYPGPLSTQEATRGPCSD